ncbi:MAG: hypothetical protein UV82_C0011G0016 [Candidatus Magasanikbacteria bacterium GW2011_GWD2_43_18]|nr:MAG: hypothetical protein UV18_C0007G0018 [Candidatus Magasanikbacteria bacterium GW2011_GWC2_42_27]KKT04088.1 MAG: hypothetical protein UV82_C0011G0016 [Candidatus Magasanikbacteria bacterium GW2011_GWD2_43_18]KKT24637.1 MAG: hypothetical protein UW10_C0022G0017 [Candidatus Magasanikbacteria bacterium GW2011_GWA2_43_9]
MPKHLKKISEEVIHENPWTQYKHDTYEKPNGEEGNYYYLETRGSSCIVPVMPDGRIVLVLQHRYLSDKQSIELPSGKIQAGSTALESAQRELLEETGWEAEEWVKVGEFNPSNGYLKTTAHVFLAQVTEQKEQQLDDTEEIDVLYRRPDEFEDMIKRGDISDGYTMAAWSLVRHRFFDTHENSS